MNLAEKLIFLRKEKHMSQLELAEVMNVSRQAVSRWETGASTPSTENLRLLGELYGVTLEYLLNDSEEASAKNEQAAAAAESETREKPTKRPKLTWKGGVICIAIIALALAISAAFYFADASDTAPNAQITPDPVPALEQEQYYFE
ncbi:MAG: helix-turn-helix domain-containing protein [Oscillospiraceae bacterium]|nr:helix-turn-helix domain-containing protein [Oscillospiraceae bacterium]